MGIMQRAMSRAESHIWFNRSEIKDRMAVAERSVNRTRLSPCLSKEMRKIVGLFYLVSMPGEVKYPPHEGYMCNLSLTPKP